MFYRELSSLMEHDCIERETVMKFDSWLGSKPVGFKGELNPFDFAKKFQVDYLQVVSLFNEACSQDILKIDFEQICPECGKCIGAVCSVECEHRCQCDSTAARQPRKLRYSYHLNNRPLLPN